MDTLQLSKILSQFDSNPLSDITPIEGCGAINKVWIGGSHSEFIIRANRNDYREFLKEAWCMAKAAEIGVPVAKVLTLGQTEGWNYMVQTCEGRQNASIHPDQSHVWRWLGQMARKLHDIKAPGFGYFMLEDQSGFKSRWRAYRNYCHPLIEKVENFAVKNEKFLGWEKGFLSNKFFNIAEKRFKFGLCHGDLKPANAVINDQGALTLIDWGCAQANIVPHFEIVEILRIYQPNPKNAFDAKEITSFLEGYELSQKEFEEIIEDIETLAYMRGLELLDWAIRDRPDQINYYLNRLDQLRNLPLTQAVTSSPAI